MTLEVLTRYAGRCVSGCVMPKVTLRANPCRFGGKVQGAGVIYELARPRSVTNEQYFHNFGSQAGMAIRQRADNTAAVNGGRAGR